MKIAILAMGTRGDVQPFLALALELQERGHKVVLAAPKNFGEWVESKGIDFHAIGIDMEAFLKSKKVRRVVSGRWWEILGLWNRVVQPMFKETLQASWLAGRDADVLIYHPKVYGAVDVSEATGSTAVAASPVPIYPTAEFPVIVSTTELGGFLNRLSWSPLMASRWPYYDLLNEWRENQLGLEKGPRFASLGSTKKGKGLCLCAVSESVVPRPLDWDAKTHMTGYWFLEDDKEWLPDNSLSEFLDRGEPPIYIGFGSMTNDSPDRVTNLFVNAVKKIGARAILSSGWGGLSSKQLPPCVHLIEKAPHKQLFPHVRAVVHHGGAGTTAAGLQAGVPTLICPQSVDQPFWAKRIFELGCGPRPLPFKQLSVDTLAERLKDLISNPSYRKQAQAIGARLASENGVARAASLIEEETRRRVYQKFRLSSGRHLAFAEYGDPQGEPVLYCHGSPGSRLELCHLDSQAKESGIRLVCPDRPGMGASDTSPPYTLLEHAQEMLELVNGLGWKDFTVAGLSGGATTMYSLARVAGSRLKLGIDLAGWAPVAEFAELAKQLAPIDQINLKLTAWFPSLLDISFKILAFAARKPSRLKRAIHSSLSPADLDWLDTNKNLNRFHADVQEAFSNGVTGAIQDARLRYQPWGFELSDIDTPISIFHGSEDRFAPLKFAKWKCAQLPNANLHQCKDWGHLRFLDESVHLISSALKKV